MAFVFALGFSVSVGFLFSPHTVSADTWGGDSEDGPQGGAMVNKLPIGGATQAKGENQGATAQVDSSNPSTGDCGWTGWALSPVKCLMVPALNALTSGLGWLASGAAGLFVWVVHPDNMSGPTGILNKGSLYELWKFIRDFFNLFFILILLLSAFATVFQVENFSIRKIFLNILIAALIINFSFPITRFLIDLANVPMYYFLNAILPGTDGGKAFVSAFLGSTGMAGIQLSSGATFTQALMNVIFMFLFTISLFVLGVTFLIRLVALTLLLVFSPFGFAATLLPGFQQLGRDWWSKFWSYAFYGPAAALMLLVAIRFQQEIGNDGTFAQLRNVTTEMSAGMPESTSIALIVFYTIPLILIWTAIGMANKFSIAGAGAVVGMGYGAARWVGKKTGRMVAAPAVGGAKWAGRKYEKFMTTGEKSKFTKYLAPTAVWKGIKQSREEQEKKDRAPVERAAASIQDKVNAVISRDHTNNEFETTEHQAAEAAKHISDVSTNADYVIDELQAFVKNGETEKAYGLLKTLAKDNNLNDLLMAEGEKYGAEMVELKDENGELVKDASGAIQKAVKISPQNFQKVISGVLAAAGEKEGSEKMAMKLMTISDVATSSGNYGAGGMAKFKGGKWVVADPEEQAKWASSKIKNLESQERQRKIHPDSMFEYYYDQNGKKQFLDLSTSGVEIAKTFTQGDVSESKRSRDDLKQGMYELEKRRKAGQAPERFKKAADEHSIILDYTEKIDEYFTAKEREKAKEEETNKELTEDQKKVAEMNRLKKRREEKTRK